MQGIDASPAMQSSRDHSEAAWVIEDFKYLAFEPVAQDIESLTEEGIEPWMPGAELYAEASAVSEEDAAASEEEHPLSSETTELPVASEARRQGYEAGRRQGHEEGRAAAEEQARAELAEQSRAADQQRKAEFERLVQNFDGAYEHYLHAVESEIVRLALAIAARILRREAQMDPLLLTGAVRVALGQIASTSKVRLMVPPADLELWKEAIAHLPKLAVRPEIVSEENMRLGDCMIETELGSVDLGVRAQLGEIEHGFFDRPGIPAVDSHTSAELGRGTGA